MKTLENAFPIVASALGSKFGVKVRIGGQQAATDGETVILPSLNPGRPDVAWGYLAHEAAHIRFSDMGAVRQAAKDSPLTREILNALEDPRIECAIRSPYPGTRTTIDAMGRAIQEAGGFEPPRPTDHPAEVLQAYVLLRGQHEIAGQHFLADAAARAEAVAREVFPAGAMTRLNGLLSEAASMRSSWEALDLARRIVEMLKEESREPEPEPKSEDGGGGGSGDQPEPASGTDETAQQPRHPRGAQGDDRSDPERHGNGEPSREQGEVDDQGQQAQAGDSDGKSETEARDALKQALSATEQDFRDDPSETARQLLESDAGNGSGVGVSGIVFPTLHKPDVARSGGRLDAVKRTSAQLRARLQGLVQSHRFDRPYARKCGRRMMPSRLYRVGVGDPRVFERRHRRSAPNTAVHGVVDLSSSMHSGRDVIALDAMLALGLALEAIPGTSVGVTAFPGMQGETDQVIHLVDHGERIERRAFAFNQRGRGGTPMANALWYAAARLVMRTEARKILMVMTDGQPNPDCHPGDIIARCVASGIDVIGIGIQIDVSHLFPVAVKIDEVADLRAALFGVAEQLLLAA